jgi:hypothetical protein
VQLDETWLLTLAADGTAGSWRCVETQGRGPCARTGHALAAVVLGGKRFVVLVGGCSAAHGFLSDAFVLDTTTWAWSAVPASPLAPSPRDKLSAVALDGRVLLYGGFGPQLEVAADGDGAEVSEEEEEQEEEQEEAERGASFTWFNDLFALEASSTGAWTWALVTAGGHPPEARAAHAACAVNGAMVVMGGRTSSGRTADAFSLAGASWTSLCAPDAPKPAARSFAAMAGVPNGALLYGGTGVDDSLLSSLEVLDMRGEGSWAQPSEVVGAPPARPLAAAALLGTRLLVVLSAVEEAAPCSSFVMSCAAVMTELASVTGPL